MKYTKKRKYTGGVHTREDVPHYHYFVKYPNGSTRHVSEAQHCVSAPAKTLPKGQTVYTDKTCAVESWKLKTLIDTIKENMLTDFRVPLDIEKPFSIFVAPEINTKPLTYFKIYSDGLDILPLSTKLRDIRFDVPDVGTQTLRRSFSGNPFIVVYNEELTEDPKYDYLKEALDARVALTYEKNELEPDTQPPTPEFEESKVADIDEDSKVVDIDEDSKHIKGGKTRRYRKRTTRKNRKKRKTKRRQRK